MYIRQLYTNCLSEAAYYIESEGEAAIIDPLRDITDYIELAKERKSTIKYIFETHFHADFVSGHLDLAKQTGAPIIFGPAATTSFEVLNAVDGEAFKLGKITIQAMHTPGHTLESTCYLLKDETGKPHAIFTGDTLFVGDVGRPDLSSGSLSSEELAGIMYDTLQQKILPLSDDIIVYPAHGPGSSCGKNLGPNTYSTIGEERQNNYALNQPSKDAFIEAITTGLANAPKYFAINARINQQGYFPLEEVKEKGTKALSVEEFKKLADNAVILDTRHSDDFTAGFIPGSIFIGLDGRFAEWAGNLLSFESNILIIAEEGKEEEAVIRLSRVGFDKMQGYLKGGLESWRNAGEKVDMIVDVDADELAMDLPFDDKLIVVDVRNETEFANGHVEDAINIPLAGMIDVASFSQFEDTQNLYLHCGGGYRSVIAASLMKMHGYNNLRNVLGGWSKIREQKNIKTVKEGKVLN